MTPTNIPPVKTAKVNGNGHHHNGNAAPPAIDLADWPKKRLSIFPLMMDFGLVLIGFGIIIVRPLMDVTAGYSVAGAGGVLVVIAAFGWLREARADYKKLKD
jgi:hypothetical protein